MNHEWLKQTDEFNHIWQNRHQPPQITESWVSNEWAKGRTNYLTFLIRIREEKIIDSIKEIQAELTGYRCFEAFPTQYLHVTVKELNSFLVNEKRYPDEYLEEELPKLIEAAKEKIRPFNQFELRLENLNNFGSTICVQAHDGGVIRRINGALLQIPGVNGLPNDFPRFLPHVSIGQFISGEDYGELIEYIGQIRGRMVGSLLVDGFELVVAKLPVRGRFPKLENLEYFHL